MLLSKHGVLAFVRNFKEMQCRQFYEMVTLGNAVQTPTGPHKKSSWETVLESITHTCVHDHFL